MAIPLLLLPAAWAIFPLELWFGGTAFFAGGRRFPAATPWHKVAAGPFRSSVATKVRTYLGFERGFYVSFGDWYYTVSWFEGRTVSISPSEQVPDRLYRPEQ